MIGEANPSPYTGVPGWLTIPEEDLLIQLARGVPEGGVIANIGVEFGRSMATFLKYSPTTVSVFGIEIKPLEAYRLNLREALLPAPPLIVGSSNDPATVERFKELSADRGADLCLIDGDHSINGALADFMLWTPLVKVGGFVCIHDCACATNTVPHHTHYDVTLAIAKWLEKEGAHWAIANMVDTMEVFKRLS